MLADVQDMLSPFQRAHLISNTSESDSEDDLEENISEANPARTHPTILVTYSQIVITPTTFTPQEPRPEELTGEQR